MSSAHDPTLDPAVVLHVRLLGLATTAKAADPALLPSLLATPGCFTALATNRTLDAATVTRVIETLVDLVLTSQDWETYNPAHKALLRAIPLGRVPGHTESARRIARILTGPCSIHTTKRPLWSITDTAWALVRAIPDWPADVMRELAHHYRNQPDNMLALGQHPAATPTVWREAMAGLAEPMSANTLLAWCAIAGARREPTVRARLQREIALRPGRVDVVRAYLALDEPPAVFAEEFRAIVARDVASVQPMLVDGTPAQFAALTASDLAPCFDATLPHALRLAALDALTHVGGADADRPTDVSDDAGVPMKPSGEPAGTNSLVADAGAAAQRRTRRSRHL